MIILVTIFKMKDIIKIIYNYIYIYELNCMKC